MVCGISFLAADTCSAKLGWHLLEGVSRRFSDNYQGHTRSLNGSEVV